MLKLILGHPVYQPMRDSNRENVLFSYTSGLGDPKNKKKWKVSRGKIYGLQHYILYII